VTIVFKVINFSYDPRLLPYMVTFDIKFAPCMILILKNIDNIDETNIEINIMPPVY